jgi:hypothetical protein
MPSPARLAPALFLVILLASACATVRYDLAGVPLPISASPVGGADGDRFVLHDKHVLWLHGLAGETQPDIAAVLMANCLPCAGIADFRVSTASSFHDWLVTHVTFGLVRMKTVTVTGLRLRPRR